MLRNMLIFFFFFLRGGTQERKMTDQVKKNKDIKEDEERLKGPENRKYVHFIFIFSSF